MKFNICVFILAISINSFAQEAIDKIEDLNGIWVNSDDESNLSIYNDFKFISIYDDDEYAAIRF